MISMVAAIIPVFLLIAVGYGLKQWALRDEEGWALADKLNYFVLFPALLVITLGTADLSNVPMLGLAGALLGAVITASALVFAIRPALNLSWPSFSSVFQGAVRWNGFVALAIVSNLLGPEGVTIIAFCIVTLVPTINVASILVLSGNHTDKSNPIRRISLAVVGNPLILGCLVGLTVNPIPWVLDNPLGTALKLLGGAALPLGLLSVGAGLTFREMRDKPAVITVTLAIKLILLPLLIALWCSWLGVEGLPRQVAITAGAVPGAASAYVLARQMGGDAPLMATLITLSVLASIVTMPLIQWLTA
jgi:predicted permease